MNDKKLKEIPLKKPNQGAIEGCRKILADLESGELRSYLAVVAYHDGQVSKCWGGMDERAPRRRMIGEFEYLKQSLLAGEVLDEMDLP